MKDIRAVLLLFAILFLATADNQLLLPLLTLLADDLSVSLDRAGLLVSAYALSAAVFNVFLGPLTDRYGRVMFFRLGLAAFAAAAAASWASAGFHSLLALRCATGLCAGLLSTVTISYVGDRFPYSKRGRVMGVVLSSYFAALILGVPAGAAIAQNWGWRSAFLSTASLAALLAAACLALPSDRRAPRGQASGTSPLRSYRLLLSNRRTHGSLWVSFCVSGGTLAFLAYISAYLSEAFGLSTIQVSQVFLIAGLAALAGAPLAGLLSDRYTKSRVFLLSNTVLALPLLALTSIEWGAPLYVLLFAISLAIAFRQTALQTLQTHLAGEERRGAYIALRNGFSQLGIACSVYLAGRLYSWQGYEAVAAFAAALTLLSSAIFLVAVRGEEATG